MNQEIQYKFTTLTKELAEKYLEFSKTDSYMLNEYEKFVDSMNEWYTYVDELYDYPAEEY